MTSTESVVPDTAERLVKAARALGPLLREHADEAEHERRLPLPVVQAMRAAGIFRMTMPRSWGGLEADPLTQLRVIEALAEANGAAGWAAMIGCDGGFASARLDQHTARELYGDIDAPTAFVVAPDGRALPVAGGYRVSGRWAFGSGCQHSSMLASQVLVMDGEAPRFDPAGRPELRICILPGEAVQIIDTWTTTGLRGSGSHDYAVTDLFVPAEHTFLFSAPAQRPEPLYVHPWMLVVKGSGVPLGIGRGAIDDLRALAATKKTVVRTNLRDEAYAQTAVAKAEALVRAARAYVFAAAGDLWAALQAGDPLARDEWTQVRLAMVFCADSCVQAVDLCYHAAGSAALYATSPLDRRLRDIHTLHQHVMTSLKVYETAGRALFGLSEVPVGF